MKKKHRPSGDGYAVTFHGSYNSKDKAIAKAKKRDGVVLSRLPRGMKRRRYIVITGKVPF